jgi:hypothetical protein
MGPGRTKLGRNVHWMVIYKIFVFGADRNWMVIYKIFVFGADRKSNMAARAYNVF